MKERGLAQSLSRGFTLIELLVVIAIIGLLAAVVLASVGGARNKGADAAVQSQLNAARNQAELFAASNGNSYSGVCDAAQAAEGMESILTSAASSTGATVQTGTGGSLVAGDGAIVTCNDAATEWAIEAPLSGSTNTSPRMWWVDSPGTA